MRYPEKFELISGVLMKKCSKCKKMLPQSAFSKAKQMACGYRSNCNSAECTGRNRMKRYLSELLKGSKQRSAYRGRKKRGDQSHIHTLTLQDLFEMWSIQRGHCAYSQLKMTHIVNSDWRASIERLDNTKGYTRDNCVLICLEFNGVKQMNREKVEMLRSGIFPDVTTNFESQDVRRFVSTLMCRAIWSSKKRKHEPPTITKQWIEDQYHQQGNCGYYSSAPLVFEPNAQWKASLERLDENQSYTPSNTVIICHELNTGKTQWSREKVEFVREAGKVLGKRRRE